MRILVTGGLGYIGSHTCVELIAAGHQPVIIDNQSVGTAAVADRISTITGVRPVVSIADIRDQRALSRMFAAHDIEAVIHFAAMKAVGESTEIPLAYFDNNVGGTATLLNTMYRFGVRDIVFSSSCSIYGDTDRARLDESAPSRPANPYAWTKWTCEQMLEQACRYHSDLRAISLRYFNPIGAHASGLLGEDPAGIPRNIMPYLARIAAGQLDKLHIFGGDYPTPDGTAIRDYVHVSDIATGHVDALRHLDDPGPRYRLFNLGTGTGTSVLELRAAFAEASGAEIPYQIDPRRDGDVPRLVADTAKVEHAWDWHATHSLDQMCVDAWRYQRLNGYRGRSGRLAADSLQPAYS